MIESSSSTAEKLRWKFIQQLHGLRQMTSPLTGGHEAAIANLSCIWENLKIYDWLVVLTFLTILKNMSSSMGKDDIPYMKWKIKTMFETTNQMRNENAKNHMEKIEIVADLQLLGTLVTCLTET